MMTKEDFTNLLKSYGFVQNGDGKLALPCGPNWWTYNSQYVANNCMDISSVSKNTVFFYGKIDIDFSRRCISFVQPQSQKVRYDFDELAELLPQYVNDIKNAIKQLRKRKIEEL